MWLIRLRPRLGNNPNLTSHKDTKLRSFYAAQKDLLAVITMINVWCFSRLTDARGVWGGGALMQLHTRGRRGDKFNGSTTLHYVQLSLLV